MPKPTITDIQALMSKLVFPFYTIERDVSPPIEPRRFENDVEHSWSLAFLACSLALQIDAGLDVGKVAQFAIVHDLVEIFANDTSPWQDLATQATKSDREAKALKQIEKLSTHFPWIVTTIKSYEAKDSKEATFVWAVDKILPLIMRILERGQYYQEQGITSELFHERLAENRKKAHAHPIVGEYYDQLIALLDSHPEYFARSK